MEDFLFLISPARSLQKSKEEKQRLVEEKGEKSEGIWDLDPGAMEKAEHEFSGQP